jgi:methionyl aminopeptidase
MLMVSHSKSLENVDKMRDAANILVGVLDMIEAYVKPGVTTGYLDKLCRDYIVDNGGIPACVGYQGYQHATCISVNHVVCHGIPGEKTLKDGDLLNIDVVVAREGMHADSSAMFFAGKPTIAAKRLAAITQDCLYLGILEVKPGATLGNIGAAIQTHAGKYGYSVVRDFCGHGIGAAMHETPEVRHFGKRGSGQMLLPGMTFTIEPMLNAGRQDVQVMPDAWTVVTKDHSLSAQWEHTVLVTNTGVEILTLRASENERWNFVQSTQTR